MINLHRLARWLRQLNSDREDFDLFWLVYNTCTSSPACPCILGWGVGRDISTIVATTRPMTTRGASEEQV